MIEMDGLSAYQVKKVILEDGKEIELDNITHLFIMKESTNEKGSSFCSRYNIINHEDYITMSNHCTMMAHILFYMKKYKLNYSEAFTKYQLDLEIAKFILEKEEKEK